MNVLRFFQDVSNMQQEIGYNLTKEQLKRLQTSFKLERDDPEYTNSLRVSMIVMSAE